MFHRKLSGLTLGLLLILCSGDLITIAQSRVVKAGENVEVELRSGQSVSLQLSLTPLDFARLSVNAHNQEVTVKVIAPGGKELVVRELSRESTGEALVSFISGYWGDFRFEITSREKEDASEKIEVRFTELRMITPQDANRIAAEMAFAEGEKFRSREANEERRPAIAKYEEALVLWQKISDRAGEAAALNALARVHDNLNEVDQALNYFNRAMQVRREIKDRAGEASSLSGIANIYNGRGNRQKAEELFLQVLQIRRELKDRRGEAGTLHDLGVAYQGLNQRAKAAEYYQQALQIRREIKDRRGEAASLVQIGVVSRQMGKFDQALESYQQALSIFQAVKEKRGEAATLSSMGVLFLSQGKRQEALEYYKRALEIQHALNARRQEAQTLSSIGATYDEMGELRSALDYHNRALEIRRGIDDQPGIANSLQGIGNVYSSMGEIRRALDYYNEARPLMRKTGGPGGEATALFSIGVINGEMGDRQVALDHYQQALTLWRESNFPQGQAAALAAIGNIYHRLEEHQLALGYLNQALEIRRQLRNPIEEANLLTILGVVSNAMDDRQKSLEYLEQALKLAKDDRRVTAGALNSSALVHRDLEDYQKAIGQLNQALSLAREIGDRSLEANTLHNIGFTYRSMKSTSSARENLHQSLEIFRGIGMRAKEAATLYGLACVENDSGDLKNARSQIEAAIEIAESLRAGLGNEDLRASYFASVQKYYDLYIELLMKMHDRDHNAGFDAAALQVSERARARSLLDLLNESGANIRQGVDPLLLGRERELQQTISAKAMRQTQLRLAKSPPAQIEEISSEIRKLTAEHQSLQSQIRTTSPRYAALTQPRPLTVREIQEQVLDRDTVLLEYSLGDERCFLWAVTPTSLRTYQLPKREVVEEAARKVYELLTARNRNETGESEPDQRRRVAQADARLGAEMARLSRMLLGRVAPQLGKKRLIIVAQGALQYIPFGALPLSMSPRRPGRRIQAPQSTALPLIYNHEVVSVPSASTVAVLRREIANRKPAEKTLAVFADPVFERDDERVTKAAAKVEPQKAQSGAPTRLLKHTSDQFSNYIPRLPFTRQEAERILALVPEGERRSAIDFSANRAAITDSDLTHYRFIHFATHGMLNSQNPELSAILLSLVDENGKPQDGFLRALDVYNLNLPAEAVVLSACETGLGKQVKGEGLVGLTRGFMYAGAPRVVVSLWAVNDRATAELMTRLYQKMIKERLRPAASLRAAQIEMLRDTPWKSPYFWAAFVVQGEWR